MELQDLEHTKQVFNEAKAQELAQEAGGTVKLTLVLPDGQQVQHEFPAGVTVAYVKLVVEQQHGHPVASQVLLLGGKPLVDPFSLCDYPAMAPGSAATVEVQLKGQ